MKDTIRNISNILRYSNWDSAQQNLQSLNIKWDSYTINQVLKTHPPMQKSWLFFNWASGLKGFKHDQFTYTTMMDIFGEAKRISSMLFLFNLMEEKGVKIDVVTYTSMLHWLSNDGDVDASVKLWEEMKEKGVFPTVVTYTAYIKVLFSHGRVKEATEVYKEMIRSGCEPNCFTYTVLMEHLATCGEYDFTLLTARGLIYFCILLGWLAFSLMVYMGDGDVNL
ncbi:pentatricopeptide repeat-containing protein [Tanacetum coccineum]